MPRSIVIVGTIVVLGAAYLILGRIRISTGLNPCHFGNLPSAAFTWFIKDGESLTNGLGIAMQEVYFLECLFARLKPKSIFIIGNSAGWSSLALALLNPQARCVAIDAGFDRNALDGLDFTNRVAERKLNRFPRFVTGFNFANFSATAFG